MDLLQLPQLLHQPRPQPRPQPPPQLLQPQQQPRQLALQLPVKSDELNNKLNTTMESKQELFAAPDLAHGCQLWLKNWTSQKWSKENNGPGNRGASTPTATTAFPDPESTTPLKFSQPNKPPSTETTNAEENNDNKLSNI